MSICYQHEALHYAWETPLSAAVFKSAPEDFCVDEDLGYTPSGSGEHLCVRIRKTALTTRQVVERLARCVKAREADIGFAGQKDKQGVCTQWFSICIPGSKEPDLSEVQDPNLQILEQGWNSKKIRSGTHRANHFKIRLRQVQNWNNDIEKRLNIICAEGVPNYYGEQRFGKDGGNITSAQDWFAGKLKRPGRLQRSMFLSAARSAVFNTVLSERVQAGDWNLYREGDVMNLAGSESVFIPEQWDDVLQARLQEKDIHPTGPLWGRGELRSTASTRELEVQVQQNWQDLCAGLESHGLNQERRSLRLMPQDLNFEFAEENTLVLKFNLPPGAFATTVLREICRYQA